MPIQIKSRSWKNARVASFGSQAISFGALLLFASATVLHAEDSAWVQLFRPNDATLSDWIMKFQGSALGVNQNNVFRYAAKGTDSASPGAGPRLEVVEATPWNATTSAYGHLFYKTPFSYYLLRSQYHFTSKTSEFVSNGGWTIQNNGLMLHCQNPNTMTVGQSYPNSIEDQLLGYWSQAIANPPDSRNSNVCVPGVTIRYNNQWYSDNSGHHCTAAKPHSLAYDSALAPNVWMYVQAKVLADSTVTFWVRSRADTAWDSVMNFSQIHTGNAPSTTALENGSVPLSQGYIAIQAEGTSTEFAKIELLNLVGCMNKNSAAYRTYFVQNDSTQCAVSTLQAMRPVRNSFSIAGNRIYADQEILKVEVFDVRGERVSVFEGQGKKVADLIGLKPGIHAVRVTFREGATQCLHVQP
jgi:hypothetical protein